MSEKPDIYGDDTWEVFNAYKAGTVSRSVAPDGKLRISITSGDEEIVLLQDPLHEHVSLTLFCAKETDEKRGEYAQRLYLNQSEFPKWTAVLNPQKMPWETLLHVMLLMPKLPTLAQADHIFMELGLPGLLTRTCDLEENKRNYVIRNFFVYAATLKEETPRRNRIALLQHALMACELKLTIRKSKQALVLAAVEPTEEELALFGAWKAALGRLTAQDYGEFRKELLGRYMKKNHFSEICTALEQIQFALSIRFPRENGEAYDIERITKFFHSMDIKQRNKGKRDWIIHIGIVMACSLEDINRMLREANCAYLYPHSCDPHELSLIEKLTKNTNYI